MINSASVFVVSGGAKGITAQCIIKLTQYYKCKSILLGRSSANIIEPDWAINCFDDAELKKRIMQYFLNQGEKPTPIMIQKLWKSIISKREINHTLAAIKKAGGTAEYINVDITNLSHLQPEINAAIKRLGAITGIIHGAGNLADKLIENKTETDFENVYNAKVKGLENLLQCIPPEQIKYLVLFSSIAGFFGSAGQTDYAIANEILNKSAHLIKYLHPNCHVVAINWGPWNSGMVTPELQKIFLEKHIKLIPLEIGAEMLLEELKTPEKPPQILISSPIPPPIAVLSTTLHNYRIRRKINLADNPFLNHHCIGKYPVLPSTCAAAWMINTCAKLYPGFQFSWMQEFQVMKGIVFDQKQPDEFIVDLKEIIKNNLEIVLEVLICSESKNSQINYQKISHQIHYTSKVKLQSVISSVPVYYNEFNNQPEIMIPGDIFYANKTLFQGKSFQGINTVINLSPKKITTLCISHQMPEKNYGQFPIENFNPYIADVLCQSILIWLKNYSYPPGLSLAIQKIEQFKFIPFGEKYYVSTDIQAINNYTIIANITAHDVYGKIYLKLSNVKAILNKNLQYLFEENHQS